MCLLLVPYVGVLLERLLVGGGHEYYTSVLGGPARARFGGTMGC
jgi:hypothetical protein